MTLSNNFRNNIQNSLSVGSAKLSVIFYHFYFNICIVNVYIKNFNNKILSKLLYCYVCYFHYFHFLLFNGSSVCNVVLLTIHFFYIIRCNIVSSMSLHYINKGTFHRLILYVHILTIILVLLVCICFYLN